MDYKKWSKAYLIRELEYQKSVNDALLKLLEHQKGENDVLHLEIAKLKKRRKK